MKTSTSLFMSLAVLLMAAGCQINSHDNGREPKGSEIARVSYAVSQYHSRMNQEQYDQIWDEMLPYSLRGTRESDTKFLSWIHERYGTISRGTLVNAVARPGMDKPDLVVVECWYETEAEKGKYMDHFVWHLIGDDTKLAFHELWQYDENGQLYKIFTLYTGLGPNDYENSKVVIGKVKRNVQ
jgi:hypothetical protein